MRFVEEYLLPPSLLLRSGVDRLNVDEGVKFSSLLLAVETWLIWTTLWRHFWVKGIVFDYARLCPGRLVRMSAAVCFSRTLYVMLELYGNFY